MNIYLAKLREKPIPNIQYKHGHSIFLGQPIQKIVAIEIENLEDSTLEIPKEDSDSSIVQETIETKPRKPCKIVDNRAKETFDYDLFMDSLRKKYQFPVRKQYKESQIPVQDKEIEESDTELELQEPILDKPEIEKEDGEEKESELEEQREPSGPKTKSEKTPKEIVQEIPKEKVIIKRKTKKPQNIDSDKFDGTRILEGSTLKQRLPKYDDFRMRASSYYMNNRKKFISHLSTLFGKYKQELMYQTHVETCDDKAKESKKGEFNLMIHQRVVSDYLNLYTPYRGLLLYHGLGSGKTCTSISIAEGMKSQKKIYVLTLASLKANFF